MIRRGLRTGILVNMAMLLLAGMLLIDFVLTITLQRDLIETERSKGALLLAAVETGMRKTDGWGPDGPTDGDWSYLDRLFPDNVIGAMVLDRNGRPVYAFARNDGRTAGLKKAVLQAIETGREKSEFRGKTWGVFWTNKSGLVLSVPFLERNRVAAAAGIALSLDSVYQTLRNAQKILLVYMIINTLLLTLVGLYRLTQIYLRPVQRLVKIAEAYEDENELIFSVRKQDNELNKLSNALNLMLKRISQDKEKLKQTVASLKQANIELKQAQDEMIRAEKLASIGRLSSGLAHEIGNPIGIVIGYLDLLKQSRLSAEDRAEYLRRAEEEINRINKIIRQLLDFSRPSKTVPAEISVHDILNDMAAMLDSQPITANLKLSLALNAKPDRLFADADQLRQVFLNLIINAADAVSAQNDKPGELKIETESILASHDQALNGRKTLKVSFTDNGSGISAAHLANIFDPFYTTKEPGKGTGLGLSVCFMIVENMGGTIQAKSEAGAGTSVTLLLPAFSDKNQTPITLPDDKTEK